MLLDYLFILGVSVEAITGALAAGRKKLDLFGVCMIAMITGLGGGTIRDVLIHHYPLTWVKHPYYLGITFFFGAITVVFASYFTRLRRVFLILNALGLATFAVIGCQKAIMLGLPTPIVITSGMLTGICGGMLRDILCNDVPLVLQKEIYAVVALAGGCLYVSLRMVNLPTEINVFVCIASMFTLRLIAIFYNLEVPKFDHENYLP